MLQVSNFSFSWIQRAVLGLLLIGLLPLSASAQQGMKFFQGSWEEALAESKNTGKPVFVDAYTTWCGPCKKMAKTVFTRADVGDFYNKHFVNYKMDMEKGEGPDFAKKYAVSSYPTLLFINAEGEILKKEKGARHPDNFIEMGRTVLFDEDALEALSKRYEAGERELPFMRDYLNALIVSGDAAKQRVAKEYLDRLSDEDFKDPENMSLIYDLANRTSSPAFKVVMDQKEAYIEKFGPDSYKDKILKSAVESMKTAVEDKDKTSFQAVRDLVAKSGIEKADDYAHRFDLEFYEGTADWKKYAKSAVSYVDKYNLEDPMMLNKLAWNFYLNVDSKKYLNEAKNWAERSVAKKSLYANNDTLAALLYKLGDNTAALIQAEKAIAIAKMSRKPYTKTEKLLDQILAR